MISLPQDDIPVDMWLHVATDALARYVAGDDGICGWCENENKQ